MQPYVHARLLARKLTRRYRIDNHSRLSVSLRRHARRTNQLSTFLPVINERHVLCEKVMKRREQKIGIIIEMSTAGRLTLDYPVITYCN